MEGARSPINASRLRSLHARALPVMAFVIGCVVVGCASDAGDHGSSGSGPAAEHLRVGLRRPHVAIVTAAGDICTSTPASCASTADLIRTIQPDVALTLGDNQYDAGTLAEYLESYDQEWGTFKEITSPVAGSTAS